MTVSIYVASGLAWALMTGCGGGCGEHVRLGDFERSQGNLEKALSHYERALAEEPGCPGADKRAEEMRRRLGR